MSDYENRRAEKIARNEALLRDLELKTARDGLHETKLKQERPAKRRKVSELPKREPLRSSARIASADTRPAYSEERVMEGKRTAKKSRSKGNPKVAKSRLVETPKASSEASQLTPEEMSYLQESWTSWTPTGESPNRDENGTFHFPSHPTFLPNKSPPEVLHEGCFGGSYFRPLYSSVLDITISNDWTELPRAWTSGLDIERHLTNPRYNPEINKYGVSCGQSIEQWEANGWINHQYDVRGWFQWYCRFFMGRRCEDDERQIGRWSRCVGERGRWRRTLLKKYVQAGINSVVDEDDDGVEGVSPAIHQTCHHWAWEVRQDVLDRWWAGDVS
jgi:hypothetical protein